MRFLCAGRKSKVYQGVMNSDGLLFAINWWAQQDLNLRPIDYESSGFKMVAQVMLT